eukprot:COSAG01_NODE_19885_length_983_cov_7.303167_1_plen_208_part_01
MPTLPSDLYFCVHIINYQLLAGGLSTQPRGPAGRWTLNPATRPCWQADSQPSHEAPPSAPPLPQAKSNPPKALPLSQHTQTTLTHTNTARKYRKLWAGEGRNRPGRTKLLALTPATRPHRRLRRYRKRSPTHPRLSPYPSTHKPHSHTRTRHGNTANYGLGRGETGQGAQNCSLSPQPRGPAVGSAATASEVQPTQGSPPIPAHTNHT